ncbi:uracil phosphoribosyltransferase [Campylobacter molothri]|uniref:uracil phosphoribosyltransferase n=1 Tax=Campylobacter molothri TaxID=1032242 RepID=UPI00301CAE89|nr:uracil phosphoribosyltransferase [Campylobacter sp. RM9753]
MNKVFCANHPLIQHKLGLLRDQFTKPFQFRMLIDEISTFLLFEATKDLNLKEVQIQTPVSKTKVKKLNEKIMICPILRAALGMLDSIFRLIPDASVGFLGFSRNEETLKADFYFEKIPQDAAKRVAIVIDPMFATGGTAIEACNFLKSKGMKKIKFISILATPQGIENFRKVHQDIEIYIAAIDEELNEKGYIVPGLGDAGDRVFNTLD